MFSSRSGPKADGPLTVHIPALAEDRPSWGKVAFLAVVGFVIGVAWPRLAGVRLGPSAPESGSGETVAAAPSAEAMVPSASAPPSTASSSGTGASSPAAAIALVPAPPAASSPEEMTAAGIGGLTVGRGFVFACKSAEGDSLKGNLCGKMPGLDAVVQPRLRSLESCQASATVSGKVHFVVRADFVRGGLTIEFGKSQGPDAPDALLACAQASLAGASVSGLPHDHAAYSIAYVLVFGAPGGAAGAPSPPSPAPAASVAANGPSQVVWDVALVRDAPKTGKVIARLQRGTPLRLGSSKDGWYTVKFGEGFSSDGWVYRGAVGR